MVPYDAYRIHEIERAKSLAEVQRADEQAARVAYAVSSLLRGVACSVRARAQAIPSGSARPAPPGLTSWPV